VDARDAPGVAGVLRAPGAAAAAGGRGGAAVRLPYRPGGVRPRMPGRQEHGVVSEPHVCVLDSYHRGSLGCRCGRWYGQLTGRMLTYAFVSQPLQERARDYGWAIREGTFEDLAAAVRAATRKKARDRAADRAKMLEKLELRQRNGRARFWRAARELLLIPDAMCAYCGACAETLDHVLPVSRWPDLERRMRNLVPACKRCNPQKGNKTPDEWKAWRLARGLPWPPSHAAVTELAS
jgi:5-methylcytosine-specific restriction endonuclease McrA